MAVMRVNPTRMELTRLKTRLQVAVRGHKLLKDKRDEMMRKFLDLIKQNKELRERVEQKLTLAFKDFLMARAVMSSEVLEEAIMFPTRKVEIRPSTGNIMGVTVPVIEYKEVTDRELSPYPYSFAATSAELDGAIAAFSDVLHLMVELAQIEKTCQMLADEIEKTRRRVNALEYVVIPQLQETIRYITMKLDENERGNRTRLMKVKDMLEGKNASV